jgi:hypothetical protein
VQKRKNIYLNHKYKSHYNLILLDECIIDDIFIYLKENLPKYFNEDFTIISVKNELKMN